MQETILFIFLLLVISFVTFKIIKKVCRPIKNKTAIFLILPTIATCGISLLVYNYFKNIPSGTGSTNKSNSSLPKIDNFIYEEKEQEKPAKKPASSFTNSSGQTKYYDSTGEYMGESYTNNFGETTFTDSTGNYAGVAFDNGLGHKTYTDLSGNVTTSNENYLGEEVFQDGTTTKTDASGNKYYQ